MRIAWWRTAQVCFFCRVRRLTAPDVTLQDDEVADLCNYMGHAENIHKEYYRQPIVSRDILRMSQLLEKAQENINANGEESNSDNVEENESSDEEDATCDTKLYDLNHNKTKKIRSYGMESSNSLSHENTPEHTDTSPQSVNSTKRKRNTSPYGKTKRRRWDNEERNTVMQLFGKYVQSTHLPPTQDILTAIKTHKTLQGRTAPQIRTWLHNQRKLKQKSNSFRIDISSLEDSNNEEDNQESLIMKHVNSLFKQNIETNRIPSADECMRAKRNQSYCQI